MSNRSHSNSYFFELPNPKKDSKSQQYDKGHKLGEGGFAVCYKATRKSDSKFFAMKVIKINDKKELSTSRDKYKSTKHPKMSSLDKANS